MDNFLWGAATSSHQVEGGNQNDWSEWEKKNAMRLSKESGGTYLPGNYISGRACDHYNRYEEDFDIAKKLGHNAHRFSIEWSRVEPEEGRFDEKEIEHYRTVLRALRERGMEPFVTLWHWTLPLWVRDKGGVTSKQFPQLFTRYAERMAQEFTNDVTFWITINEPLIFTTNAYLRGIWPPQKRNGFFYARALRNLIAAHKAAYGVVKKQNAGAQIGIAKNNVYFAGGVMRHAANWWWNGYFLNKINNTLDFVGLNYYFHNRIKGFRFNQNEQKIVSDLGWEVYPEGIYHVLLDIKKYNKPVYITENGVADANDALRADFIKKHLQWIRKAIAEGVDARGYFYWSLLDNFEWDKGFWPRFGLVEVDYKTMERRIRASAWEYKKIIEKGI
jgi:beta-glucosidase